MDNEREDCHDAKTKSQVGHDNLIKEIRMTVHEETIHGEEEQSSIERCPMYTVQRLVK